MVTGGIEVMSSVLHEQVAGPLVLFGTGGAAGDALADRAARLAPLTDSDADDLIRSVRAAARSRLPSLRARPGQVSISGADWAAGCRPRRRLIPVR